MTTGPYDPRNPDPKFVCRTRSNHPIHDELRETYVLLSIESSPGKVYFIVEGLSKWCSYDELQDSSRYFYEENTCPACGGDGKALDNGTNFGECDECDGTGQLATA